jgi:hypothetical protein
MTRGIVGGTVCGSMGNATGMEGFDLGTGWNAAVMVCSLQWKSLGRLLPVGGFSVMFISSLKFRGMGEVILTA